MLNERVESECRPAWGAAGGGDVLRFAPRLPDPAGEAAVALVAAERGLTPALLVQRGRGIARLAEARQLAMYLMHVVEGRLYAEIGRVFGRDRTTVSHACAVIEERREAAAFDEEVGRLEQALTASAMGVPFAAAR